MRMKRRRSGELKRGIIHKSFLASVERLELEASCVVGVEVVGDAVMAFTVCSCSTYGTKSKSTL